MTIARLLHSFRELVFVPPPKTIRLGACNIWDGFAVEHYVPPANIYDHTYCRNFSQRRFVFTPSRLSGSFSPPVYSIPYDSRTSALQLLSGPSQNLQPLNPGGSPAPVVGTLSRFPGCLLSLFFDCILNSLQSLCQPV